MDPRLWPEPQKDGIALSELRQDEGSKREG